MRPKLAFLVLAAALLFARMEPSSAQTVGYAEALGRLAVSCGNDINRFCRRENLGGGQVAECLGRNQSAVSLDCKASSNELGALLKKRAAARESVSRVCELDRLKFCGGIQPGDAQILGCMYQSRQHLSVVCRQALADSGSPALRLSPQQSRECREFFCWCGRHTDAPDCRPSGERPLAR